MRRFLALFMVLILSGVLAFAQDRVVTGTVTDEQGNPIPFATVSIKGTSKGSSADATGKFSLKAKQGDVLVFSSTGRTTKEVTVGASNVVNASLALGKNSLTEVVISSGYNTRRTQRSTVTNAQVVNNQQLTTIRPTSLNNALAGKVAGVQVRSQALAALDRQDNIRLHGESAIDPTKAAKLIYIVDGTVLGSDSRDINPDDVEDLTVLNGPTGAAIYGPQAAAGAVVITTKKAKKGDKRVGIEVNSGLQFDKVYNLPQYQNIYGGGNTSNFIQFHYKPNMPAFWQSLDGKYFPDYTDDASWGPRMAGQEYIPWYAWYPGTEYTGKTAKWVPQKNNIKSFFNKGVTANNNVSFTKAGDGYSGRVSYTNLDVTGLVPTSFVRKNMLSSNFSLDLGSRFTVGTSINYVTTNRNAENDDTYANQATGSFNSWFHRDIDMNIMRQMSGYTIPAGYPAAGMLASWNLGENGTHPDGYDPTNPKGFFGANYWYNHFSYYHNINNLYRRDHLYGDLSFTYKVTNDFKLRAVYHKNAQTEWNEDKINSILENSGGPTSGGQTGVYAYYGTGQTFFKTDVYEVTGTYNKKIKEFSLDLLGGSEMARTSSKNISANTNNGFNLPDGFFLTNSKKPISYSNGRSESKGRAIFGRFSVGYKNMLFLETTLRNDWNSSQVPVDYKTKTDYKDNIFTKSVGVGFVFSDLIKNNAPWLSYGKIRGSLGETPRSPDPYENQVVYGIGSDQWNNNFVMSVPNKTADRGLTGAVSQVKEAGIDLRFLKNRIGLSFTYFNRIISGDPVTIQINGASGFTSESINSGKLTNNYADWSLNLKALNYRNFTWEINMNLSNNIKNVIDSIGPGLTTFNLPSASGGVGANFSGITTPHVVHYSHEGWGILSGGGKTYMNGMPVVDASGHFVSRSDLNLPEVKFGSVLPDYTGGIQNTFAYKGVTLSVNIDFQYGGKFFSLSDMWGAYSGLTARTAGLNDKGIPVRDPVNDGGGVHVIGVLSDGKTTVDTYVDAQDYWHSLVTNNIYDDFIYDMTFVKLRELSLGYNIPVKKIKFANKWLQNANFSVVSRNPLLIYAKTKSFDPSEIRDVFGENGQYPGSRSIGFNLKLGF